VNQGGFTMIDWSNANTIDGVRIVSDPSGQIPIFSLVDTTGGIHNLNGGAGFQGAQGQWFHLAYTYNKVTGETFAYSNGIIVGHVFFPAGLTAQTSYDMYFGGKPTENTFFTGMLDEVTFFGRPLSYAEVAAIYAVGSGGKSPLLSHVAPAVNAGPSLDFPGPSASATLNGTVTDDNLPYGPPTAQWSVLVGPGSVSFANPSRAQTTATFGAPGAYLLQLTGSDGFTLPVTSVTEVRIGSGSAQPPTGIVDWWPGNGNPHELVHGNHDVQLIDGAGYAAGEVLDGFIFQNAAYGMVPASPDLDIGQSGAGFTVEFWMRPDKVNQGGFEIMDWSNANTVQGVRLVTDPSGTIPIFSMTDTAGGTHNLNSSAGFTQGQWFHLTFTYNKVTGEAFIYSNGIVAGHSFFPAGLSAQTSYDLYFGGNPNERVPFSGILDEVTFYNRPLAYPEVTSIYSAGILGKSPLLMHSAPTVTAPSSEVVAGIGSTATLGGTDADDNLPFGAPASHWSLVSGAGTVTFGNSSSAATTATFSATGAYLLELSGSDGFTQPADAFTEVLVGGGSAQPPAGIADWWPGNGNPHEVVHGNHDVQLIDGAGYATGKVLDGFIFQNAAYGKVSASPDMDIGQSGAGFTVEFWMRPDKVNQGGFEIIDWSSANTTQGVRLVTDASGTIPIFSLTDTTGGTHNLNSSLSFTQGQWLHLAFTYNKVTGETFVYSNSAVAGHAFFPAGLTAQTSYDLYFGGNPNERVPFSGMLDEVTFYARPLANSEVGAIYAAGGLGKSPLLGHQAPVVSAGANQAIASTAVSATLDGSVTDDNQPFGPPTAQWSLVTGSGTVSFANANAASTTATFSAPGVYQLQLAGSDGITSPVTASVEVVVGSGTVQPPSGIADWWPGNGNPHELIHGNHDVQLFNGATYAVGEVLDGFLLAGAKAYGMIPASPDMDIGQSSAGFTAEFWMRPDKVNQGGFEIIDWSNPSTVQGVRLITDGSGTVPIFSLADTSGATHNLNSSANFGGRQGQWIHLAFTYNKATGEADIYFNGAPAGQSFFPAGLTAQTSYDLYFGGNPNEAVPYTGMLDEVTLYTKPLAAGEVAAIFAAGADGKSAAGINQAPLVSLSASFSAFAGIATQLTATATDDGLPNPPGMLTYHWSLVSGPGTATFGTPNAAATSATFSAAGTYVVNFTASDSILASSPNTTVTVVNPPSVPVVSISSPAANAQIGAAAPFTVTATATDTGGNISRVDFYGGATLLGTAFGPAVGKPTTYFANVAGLPSGIYVLTAVATDNNGVTATSAPVSITVITGAGGLYLSVATPAFGDSIGNKVSMTGVVAGQTLVSWTASYRLQANQGQTPNPWTAFASGTTAVGSQGATPAADVPGPIGTFDPTLLLNGIYEIQLAATDTSSSITSDGPIDVVVSGNAKIGQFTLAFNDLTLQAPGIPVTITRTYDSRDSRTGDFGPGWFIGVDNIRVQKNDVIGTNWFQTELDPLVPIQFYYLTPDSEKIVSVVMPDGTDYRFMAGAFIRDPDRSGDPDDASLSAVTAGKLKFYPIGDTVGTLVPLDSSNQVDDTYLVLGTGDTELDTDDGTAIYDPTRFLLTTKDGASYILDQALGLIQVTDLSGNTLVLNRDAQNNLTSIVSTQNATGGPITSTVLVHHGAAGPVDYITDLANNKLNYAYDTQGRLSTFTDRAANVTQFFYENAAFPDYLTRVLDPLGNQAIRTVFDATGHMVQQTDAKGNVTTFAPGADPTGNFEKITDRLGNATTNYYDDQGNIVLKIDALGGQTISTFDANNDHTSVTDPLGHKTTMTYDGQKNLLTQTDPLSNTTTYTYDATSRPLTIVDALGHTTTNVYDASGNLTQTTDDLGDSTTFTYDGAGKLLSTTDALGHTTTNVYDGSGNLSQTTDASGHLTTYAYDANRNTTSQVTTRTKSDGTIETLTTGFTYDANSRLTVTTYPNGSTSQTSYNAIGELGSTIDPLGHTTTFTYDTLGDLTGTSFQDSTSETTGYDADGNAITAVDRAGHTTTTTYDALNRATQVTYVDASFTQTGYDAAGRVTSSTDALGNVTTYGYDAAGRRTTVKDAVGNTTTCGYDAAGRLVSTLDALGRTVTFTYDALNRRTVVTFPDSTTQGTSYDALGRKTVATDQAGVVTQYAYDALSRLTSVTQAATSLLPAAVTAYAYDELGHQISQTDALGHVTLYAYDSLGRRIGRTLPAGQSESYAYDAAGNVKTRTDFNGYTTTFTYDTLNRLTEKDADPTHPSLSLSYSPAKMTYAYNAMGQRSGAAALSNGGATIYSETLGYDTRNRLTSKARAVNSLGISSDTLGYTYDAQGNLSTLKSGTASGVDLICGYDPLNRLQTVSTADQQASARKVTDYTYDQVGNLESVTLPNTVTSLYTYDTLNRLTVLNVSLGGGAAITRYAYTLSPTGQRTQVVELNGRTTGYAYDSRYRLTQEAVTAGTLDPAPAGTVNYTYDQVGNRLSSTSSLAGISSQTNGFDPDDRLNSDTYDANGNTKAATILGTTVADVFDFENRLLNRNGGQVRIAYDCDGNRVAKTAGAITTTFLVDDNNPTGYAQVLEEKVNGALIRTYAYGTGLLSEGQFGGGAWKTSYYAFDGHGSTRFLSDATGTATDFYAYDAFGNLIYKNGTTANVYLFSGEQYDADLGLFFLRARYMEPARGRFWSMDPFEGPRGRPWSLHKYIYCIVDPVIGHDPSGKDELVEVEAEVAVDSTVEVVAAEEQATAVGEAGSLEGQAQITEEALGDSQAEIDAVTESDEVASEGQWVDEPYSNANGEAYDQQIMRENGLDSSPGKAYELNGVRFDGGVGSDGTLIEAKGPTYARLFEQPFGSSVEAQVVAQVQRQVAARAGRQIIWYIAEQAALPTFENAVAAGGGSGIIRLVVVPFVGG
jgi:RHS repeat-associated protein